MSILNTRWIWFSIFLALVVASVAALATWGLKVGIDFAGGTLVEYAYTQPVDQAAIHTAVAEKSLPEVTVQSIGANTVLVRSTSLDQEQQAKLDDALKSVGEGSQQRLESVGPTIGKDLTRRAVIGVVLAIVGILLYVAWAFRAVPQPLSSWQFGLAAVLTLAHDVLFTLGLFAFLGHQFNYTVDAFFITALLTVMGFSVHDTIVVFDRIRENLLKHRDWSLDDIFNASVAQTIVRSLNTSLTALIVLATLFVLGGASIKPFLVALIAGITVGTYSSILVATPLLPVLALGRRKRSTTVADRS